MKRIAVIGATGLIGGAVADLLAVRHDVVRASRTSGVRVDLEETTTVEDFFRQVRELDGVVVTAGHAAWGTASELGRAGYEAALQSKLLGQLDVAARAIGALRDGGSITLTSGILSVEAVPGSTASAVANGALEAFVRTSAYELERGLRINIVRPSVVEGSPASALDRFAGFIPVSRAEVAHAYARSVDGIQTGRVYDVR